MELIETHVLDFFDSVDFFSCSFLPSSHINQPNFALKNLMMDVVPQAQSIVCDHSLHIRLPFSCGSELFKGSIVGVDIIVLHGQFHQLIIHVLCLGSILPCSFKTVLEFGPKNFVCVCDMVGLGHVDMTFEPSVLRVYPVLNKRSPDL